MLARKPKKFSLNSNKSSSVRLHKEGSNSPSLNLQRKKSAADTATSILEELGVKKLSSTELDKKILGADVQRKIEQKKESTEDLEDFFLDSDFSKTFFNSKTCFSSLRVFFCSSTSPFCKDSSKSCGGSACSSSLLRCN